MRPPPPSAPVHFLSAGQHFLTQHNHCPSAHHCTIRFSHKHHRTDPTQITTEKDNKSLMTALSVLIALCARQAYDVRVSQQ